MAKAANEELSNYNKGTPEYEAAQYYADLFKNASKGKDEAIAAWSKSGSPTAISLPSEAQAAQKAQQEKQAATGQTGVKMKWDSKKKKFVPVT